MDTKICSKCKKELSIIHFNKGNDKDNLSYHCRKCEHEYYKIHYKPIIKNKICLICNQEFISTSNIQKFCSLCRQLGNKKQRKIHRLTPDVIFSILKQNAIQRNIKFDLDKGNFINWYNNQEKACHYCGRTLENIISDIKETSRYKSRLSIDRKDNDKGYELNNIVLACYRCNTIKGEYFTEQEMLKIGKIIYKIEVNQ
jgi:5-methylcytosine-specific restriction endonuclease McrA